MDSKFKELGINLEEPLALSESDLDLPHENNYFDYRFESTRGQGVDNKIITPSGKKIALECKNVNGKHLLTKGWFMEEFFDRDKGIPFILRVLVISILKCSKEVLRWLKEDMKVKIIELGFQITSPELKAKAIEIFNKKLYWFKMKYFGFKKSPLSIKMLSKPINSKMMYSFIKYYEELEIELTSSRTVTVINKLDNELNNKKGAIFDPVKWCLSLVSPNPITI